MATLMEKVNEWKGKTVEQISVADIELLARNAETIAAKFNEFQTLTDQLTAKRNELKNLGLS